VKCEGSVPGIWKCRDRRIDLGTRPRVMGILNVTPDSFSDGGRHDQIESAVAFGLGMVADGADVLDVGGESTRPGSLPVPVAVEKERVIPVIRELARQVDVPISVDTTKAEVASAAIAVGAVIVNDISSLTMDPGMMSVVRESGAGVVLMHMKGMPRIMQDAPVYDQVVDDVARYLDARVKDSIRAGIDADCLVVDPGIGFGKTVKHNLELLGSLRVLGERTGRPVLVGLSRKRFIGVVTGMEVDQRLAGSLAGLIYSLFQGVRVFRVHDVPESRQALALIEAIQGCSA